MEKKSVVMFALFILGILIIPSLVSADLTEEIVGLIDGTAEVIKPVSVYLIGNADTGDILFAKGILLLIIVAICWTVFSEIDYFKEHSTILYVLSIGVGILSIRFFTEDLVRAVLLPYTTLGIAVSALIPFILFFFLVNIGLRGNIPIVRRVAWIFFGAAFFGIWLSSSETAGSYRHIYLVTAIASFIMLKIDGTIARYFARLKVEKEMSPVEYHAYARLLKEYDELHKAMGEAKLENDKKKTARIRDRLNNVHMNLARYQGR